MIGFEEIDQVISLATSGIISPIPRGIIEVKLEAIIGAHRIIHRFIAL